MRVIILHNPMWIWSSTAGLSSILMRTKWSEECVHTVLPTTFLLFSICYSGFPFLLLSVCSAGSPHFLPNAVLLLPCLVKFPSIQIQRNSSCIVIPSLFLPLWVLVEVTLGVGDTVLGQGCCNLKTSADAQQRLRPTLYMVLSFLVKDSREKWKPPPYSSCSLRSHQCGGVCQVEVSLTF